MDNNQNEVTDGFYLKQVDQFKKELAVYHLKLKSELERGIAGLKDFFSNGTRAMTFTSKPFMDLNFYHYMEKFLEEETKKVEGMKLQWKIIRNDFNGNTYYYFLLMY